MTQKAVLTELVQNYLVDPKVNFLADIQHKPWDFSLLTMSSEYMFQQEANNNSGDDSEFKEHFNESHPRLFAVLEALGVFDAENGHSLYFAHRALQCWKAHLQPNSHSIHDVVFIRDAEKDEYFDIFEFVRNFLRSLPSLVDSLNEKGRLEQLANNEKAFGRTACRLYQRNNRRTFFPFNLHDIKVVRQGSVVYLNSIDNKNDFHLAIHLQTHDSIAHALSYDFLRFQGVGLYRGKFVLNSLASFCVPRKIAPVFTVDTSEIPQPHWTNTDDQNASFQYGLPPLKRLNHSYLNDLVYHHLDMVFLDEGEENITDLLLQLKQLFDQSVGGDLLDWKSQCINLPSMQTMLRLTQVLSENHFKCKIHCNEDPTLPPHDIFPWWKISGSHFSPSSPLGLKEGVTPDMIRMQLSAIFGQQHIHTCLNLIILRIDKEYRLVQMASGLQLEMVLRDSAYPFDRRELIDCYNQLTLKLTFDGEIQLNTHVTRLFFWSLPSCDILHDLLITPKQIDQAAEYEPVEGRQGYGEAGKAPMIETSRGKRYQRYVVDYLDWLSRSQIAFIEQSFNQLA